MVGGLAGSKDLVNAAALAMATAEQKLADARGMDDEDLEDEASDALEAATNECAKQYGALHGNSADVYAAGTAVVTAMEDLKMTARTEKEKKEAEAALSAAYATFETQCNNITVGKGGGGKHKVQASAKAAAAAEQSYIAAIATGIEEQVVSAEVELRGAKAEHAAQHAALHGANGTVGKGGATRAVQLARYG